MISPDDAFQFIDNDGAKVWLQNGVRHRDGAPAVVYENGTELWYQHGLFHRDDGPAIINHNSTVYWYKHGKFHRTDGPAIIWPNGSVHWYIDNQRISSRQKYKLLTGISDEQLTFLILKYGDIT